MCGALLVSGGRESSGDKEGNSEGMEPVEQALQPQEDAGFKVERAETNPQIQDKGKMLSPVALRAL